MKCGWWGGGFGGVWVERTWRKDGGRDGNGDERGGGGESLCMCEESGEGLLMEVRTQRG